MQIFHRKRGPKEIIRSARAPGALTWERKTLPDAGAQQYAFETYGTPTYDFALGNGATFIRRPLVETQPAAWVNFQAPIIDTSNMFQGQFATQPLMDPNTAMSLGIAPQGSTPPDAYNVLPPQAPVFNP